MTDSIGQRIQRATRGDSVAVDELLEEFMPGLTAFVRLRAGPMVLAQESATDVVQSACRDVLENLERFQHDGETGFRRWLYKTALRKIADRYEYYGAAKRDVRRHGAAPSVSHGPTSPAPSPSEEAMAHEQSERIMAALERLPDDYREVIWLSRYAGFSHAEIAAEMDRTEVATRSLLSRALSQLAEELQKG